MATRRLIVEEYYSWQSPVLDKDLSAPPAVPAKGDRYIVAAVASGAWTGHENDIAWCSNATGPVWSFDTPETCWAVGVVDENMLYAFFGGAWQSTGLHPQQHSIVSTSDHTSTATAGQILKADANGLPVDATNTDAEVSATVTASHARSHGITSSSDHTGTAGDVGYMMKADANGLPVKATNTDADVADAVTKKHVAATVTDTNSINMTLAGQDIKGDLVTQNTTEINLAVDASGLKANLNADGIKDTHIDWGTGANQVSAVDIPIADAGGYYGTHDIEAALQTAGQNDKQAARFTRNTNQTMVKLTWDVVDFATQTYDDNGLVTGEGADAWLFTAAVAGKYQVCARVLWDTNDWQAGEACQMAIYKTPSGGAAAIYSVLATMYFTVATNNYQELTGSDIVNLAVGDAIEIRVTHSDTVDADLLGSASQNYVAISRISA